MTIRVLVAGGAGRMGREVVKAVSEAPGMEIVAVVDNYLVGEDAGLLAGIDRLDIQVTSDLQQELNNVQPDVMVDFTNPTNVKGNIKMALEAGVRPVVGTTGLSKEDLDDINIWCQSANLGCLIAPNFAIGAILMMQFAAQAAKYLPHVEIIEMHHDQKLDAPSGTALKTAQLISANREAFRQGHFNEEELIEGARGADFDGMKIHSVRLPGYVAHQEVIFGGLGQTLTIRHDSISRQSFMPGVVLGIEKIMERKGLTYGLEHLL